MMTTFFPYFENCDFYSKKLMIIIITSVLFEALGTISSNTALKTTFVSTSAVRWYSKTMERRTGPTNDGSTNGQLAPRSDCLWVKAVDLPTWSRFRTSRNPTSNPGRAGCQISKVFSNLQESNKEIQEGLDAKSQKCFVLSKSSEIDAIDI